MNTCRRNNMCQVSTCRSSAKKHHTMLHDIFGKSDSVDSVHVNKSTTNTPNSIRPHVSKGSHSGEVNISSKADILSNAKTSDSYFPIVTVKVVSPNGKQIITNALLDSASDINICSEELITSLELETITETLTIKTVGKTEQHDSKRCSLQVCNVEDDTESACIILDDVWSVQSLDISKGHIPQKRDFQNWDHLRDISYSGNSDNKVQLLIGSCTPQVFISSEIRVGRKNDPIALKGPLGWTLLGPKTEKNKQTYVNLTQACKQELDHEVRKFWEIDSLGMKYTNEIEFLKMIKDARSFER